LEEAMATATTITTTMEEIIADGTLAATQVHTFIALHAGSASS
jgi:hypothetical protein